MSIQIIWRIAAAILSLATLQACSGDTQNTANPPDDSTPPISENNKLEPQSFQINIQDGDDDAEEYINGSVDLSSSDVELIYDSFSGAQIVALRFPIGIPKDAIIDQASIQFTTDESSFGAANLDIKVENSSNSAQLISASKNISSRLYSSNVVSWSPDEWQDINEQSALQATPDIKSLIQEITNKAEWNSCNYITFSISGEGQRIAISYDKSPIDSAQIQVSYRSTTKGDTCTNGVPTTPTETVDTQAPSAPSNLRFTEGTPASSSIQLLWDSATDNTGVAGYRIIRDSSEVASISGTSYLDSNLQAATAYQYSVIAYDAAGNTTSSNTISVSTQSQSTDTIPPSIPGALEISAPPGSVNISIQWMASTDNVGVAGYRIIRNGVFLTSTTATSFNDTSVQPSTTYQYSITAFDAANNVANSNNLLVTTADTVPTNMTGYFVSPNGNDTNSGTESSPWKTIQASIDKLKPGDTLNIIDGTYYESVTPHISGTADAPILIRAVTPFNVTIDGDGIGQALDIADVSHLIFEGFKLQNSGERAVLQVNSDDGQPTTGNTATHHISLRKMSIKGSCVDKNCVGALVARSNDILLEDVWVFGSGRYTMLVYGSRNITVRRAVVRWDYWDGAGYKPNDPRTALGVYNNHDSLFENIIVLDSGKKPPGRGGDKASLTLAGGNNGDTAPFISSDNNEFYGLVIFNNIGLALGLESRSLPHDGNYYENCVVYGNSVRGLTINKKVSNTTFNKMTVVGHTGGGGYANWSSDPDTVGNAVKNSIFTDNNDNTFRGGVSESFNMVFNNSPNYASGKNPGTGSLVMDPEQAYLFTNTSSALNANPGSDGKPRGANLTKRYFNGVESTQKLWPWLYEDKIHQDLCDPTSLAELGRTGDNSSAWCDSGKSLTRYLWEASTDLSCPAEQCDGKAEPLP